MKYYPIYIIVPRTRLTPCHGPRQCKHISVTTPCKYIFLTLAPRGFAPVGKRCSQVLHGSHILASVLHQVYLRHIGACLVTREHAKLHYRLWAAINSCCMCVYRCPSNVRTFLVCPLLRSKILIVQASSSSSSSTVHQVQCGRKRSVDCWTPTKLSPIGKALRALIVRKLVEGDEIPRRT